LQRTANIHLVYNSEPDELGGGEMSRFIKQIQQELPIYNPAIRITEQLLTTQPVVGQAYPPILIPKTESVKDAMLTRAQKGLAPTSLNAYRKCPLRFYFSAIARIEEAKETEETINPAILGSAVHEVLYQLYLPFKGLTLRPDDVSAMLPKVPEMTDQAFTKVIPGTDLAYGKNLLLVSVAKIMITNFLKEEKEQIEKLESLGTGLTIHLLEEPVRKIMEIRSGDEKVEVTIKGFVDRVDGYHNVVRIIDYKTGKVEPKELKMETWDALLDKPGLDKGFQLLTYAWLLGKDFSSVGRELESGLIVMNKLKSWFMPMNLPGEKIIKIDSNALQEYEAVLSTILEEIFDPEVPFSQTSDITVCELCPYITLCGR
ncbi:MAG: PD-(D/E)XK nuclease family protein, partial [Bacteroidota bacterium]